MTNQTSLSSVARISTLFLATALLAGCAAPYVLSERVAQHSLGEIKFAYSEDVVAIWKESGTALFQAKASENIKAKLAEELTGEQPLHLYVDIQRVIMVRKGAQVVLFLFVKFNDLVNAAVLMFPGEAGVAAPALDAIVEPDSGYTIIKFDVSTGDQAFSRWNVRIEKLAEKVAELVVKSVKYK